MRLFQLPANVLLVLLDVTVSQVATTLPRLCGHVRPEFGLHGVALAGGAVGALR